jgi:hypothetical protein
MDFTSRRREAEPAIDLSASKWRSVSTPAGRRRFAPQGHDMGNTAFQRRVWVSPQTGANDSGGSVGKEEKSEYKMHKFRAL